MAKLRSTGIPTGHLKPKQHWDMYRKMPAVYDLLTVSEHLEFVRRAYRLEDDGLAQQLLERFELSNLSDKLGKGALKGNATEGLNLLCVVA